MFAELKKKSFKDVFFNSIFVYKLELCSSYYLWQINYFYFIIYASLLKLIT